MLGLSFLGCVRECCVWFARSAALHYLHGRKKCKSFTGCGLWSCWVIKVCVSCWHWCSQALEFIGKPSDAGEVCGVPGHWQAQGQCCLGQVSEHYMAERSRKGAFGQLCLGNWIQPQVNALLEQTRRCFAALSVRHLPRGKVRAQQGSSPSLGCSAEKCRILPTAQAVQCRAEPLWARARPGLKEASAGAWDGSDARSTVCCYSENLCFLQPSINMLRKACGNLIL